MVASSSEQSLGRDGSSISSEKIYKDPNYREEKLWNVERKQYELIIANCNQKIEELLHSEMEYKKTIY